MCFSLSGEHFGPLMYHPSHRRIIAVFGIQMRRFLVSIIYFILCCERWGEKLVDGVWLQWPIMTVERGGRVVTVSEEQCGVLSAGLVALFVACFLRIETRMETSSIGLLREDVAISAPQLISPSISPRGRLL